MKFSIHPSVFGLLPQLRVAALWVQGARNGESPPALDAILQSGEENVRAHLDLETHKEHPFLSCWDHAYRAFGANPNKYPPSINSLVKRVLKENTLPRISSLVDIYNAISLNFLLPLGSIDLDSSTGDINLSIAQGGEEFYSIGATENDPAEEGEVIYRDATGVLTRRCNWRESDRAKVTHATTDVLLLCEIIDPIGNDVLENAWSQLSAYTAAYCGGIQQAFVLSESMPSMDLVPVKNVEHATIEA